MTDDNGGMKNKNNEERTNKLSASSPRARFVLSSANIYQPTYGSE